MSLEHQAEAVIFNYTDHLVYIWQLHHVRDPEVLGCHCVVVQSLGVQKGHVLSVPQSHSSSSTHSQILGWTWQVQHLRRPDVTNQYIQVGQQSLCLHMHGWRWGRVREGHGNARKLSTGCKTWGSLSLFLSCRTVLMSHCHNRNTQNSFTTLMLFVK